MLLTPPPPLPCRQYETYDSRLNDIMASALKRRSTLTLNKSDDETEAKTVVQLAEERLGMKRSTLSPVRCGFAFDAGHGSGARGAWAASSPSHACVLLCHVVLLSASPRGSALGLPRTGGRLAARLPPADDGADSKRFSEHRQAG